VTRGAIDDAKAPPLEDHARPLQAIYRHWERHQWSPFGIDLSTDTATFQSLDDAGRDRILWILGQRFRAEFNVAALLGPFLTAAPDYETALVLATQVADEHRHVQSLVHIYEQVVGVRGGIDEIEARADAYVDTVASTLYEALDAGVRPLATQPDEDTFLIAVIAYHVIGEGVVGETTQRLLPRQLDGFGAFPGLIKAQRLATLDESRHIAFGVTHARRRVSEDREHAWSVFGYVVEGFREIVMQLLDTLDEGLRVQFRTTYGIEAEQIGKEVMRTLDRRLRSIGIEQGTG
jgi:ribonucleotide reductase beta subunit family protein with ferritin-like domain